MNLNSKLGQFLVERLMIRYSSLGTDACINLGNIRPVTNISLLWHGIYPENQGLPSDLAGWYDATLWTKIRIVHPLFEYFAYQGNVYWSQEIYDRLAPVNHTTFGHAANLLKNIHAHVPIV